MTEEEEWLTSFHFLPPPLSLQTLRSAGIGKALKKQTSDQSTLSVEIIHEY